MNLKRYHISNVSANRYYQTPKFLFDGQFKGLSNDARILYSILKDRHELSYKNNWVNDIGEVYIIFPREEMCEMIGCSQPTLRKAVNILKESGLIEEERVGLSKPNRIYLCYIDTILNDSNNVSLLNEKSFQSRVKESFSQECKNLSVPIIGTNETNSSETYSSQSVNSYSYGNKTKDSQEDRQTDKCENKANDDTTGCNHSSTDVTENKETDILAKDILDLLEKEDTHARDQLTKDFIAHMQKKDLSNVKNLSKYIKTCYDTFRREMKIRNNLLPKDDYYTPIGSSIDRTNLGKLGLYKEG